MVKEFKLKTYFLFFSSLTLSFFSFLASQFTQSKWSLKLCWPKTALYIVPVVVLLPVVVCPGLLLCTSQDSPFNLSSHSAPGCYWNKIVYFINTHNLTLSLSDLFIVFEFYQCFKPFYPLEVKTKHFNFPYCCCSFSLDSSPISAVSSYLHSIMLSCPWWVLSKSWKFLLWTNYFLRFLMKLALKSRYIEIGFVVSMSMHPTLLFGDEIVVEKVKVKHLFFLIWVHVMVCQWCCK